MIMHYSGTSKITDTLGAGVLSTVERLSLSWRFTNNKPRPSILRSRIGYLLLRGVACSVFMQTCSERTQDNQNRLSEGINGLSRCRYVEILTHGFDLRLLSEAILYRPLSFGGRILVRCPEFRGCLYLGG